MSKLTFSLILISFYAVFVILGHTISGFIERSYATLSPEQEVKIDDKIVTASGLAAQYQPSFYIDRHIETPPLNQVLYEVIDTTDQVIITYRTEWEDEHHPNQVVDALYKTYRFFYYGLTVKDIELIQVNVEKQTGEIVKVLFEQPALQAKYDSEAQPHYESVITLDEQSDYVQTIYDEDGQMVERKNLPSSIKATDLQFEISSWNHLHLFRPTLSETDEHRPLAYSLVELDAPYFKKHKLVRRAQGDVATVESGVNSGIIFATGILPLLYLFGILRYYNNKKRQSKEGAKGKVIDMTKKL